MKGKILVIAAILVIGLHVINAGNKKEDVIIAVASSLRNVFEDIIADYERLEPETDVKITRGASGVLKTQIINQAPIDIFAFASMEDGKELVQKKFVEKDDLYLLCKNSMALITRKKMDENEIKDFLSLKSPAIKKIAIGNPVSVPAGRYARALLDEMNLYGDINNKLIFTDSVRQALTYLEMGEVDASIVFRTDALISPKVKIVVEIHDLKKLSIEYSIGITEIGAGKRGSRKILQYILGNEGRKILLKYGFILP